MHLNKVLFNLHYFIYPQGTRARLKSKMSYVSYLTTNSGRPLWTKSRQKGVCEANAYLFTGPWGLLAYSIAHSVAPATLLSYEHCGTTMQFLGVKMYKLLHKKSIYTLENVCV